MLLCVDLFLIQLFFQVESLRAPKRVTERVSQFVVDLDNLFIRDAALNIGTLPVRDLVTSVNLNPVLVALTRLLVRLLDGASTIPGAALMCRIRSRLVLVAAVLRLPLIKAPALALS